MYWFRTPPGVRIGRSALDEDAIRLIEEHNPDVEFDWTRILRAQEAPVESRSPQTDRRNRQRGRDGQREPAIRPTPVPGPPQPAAVAGSMEARIPGEIASIDEIPPSAEARLEEREEEVATPEVDIIEEFLAEPRLSVGPVRPQPGDALSVVESRLGSEGLSRLRARYSEVLARISETIADPLRQDELKAQAERLNPDTWVTDAEVTAGLESYESVFESLRSVVGRRRRRRRRSSGRSTGRAAAESPAEIPESGPPTDNPGEDGETDRVGPSENQQEEQ